MTISETFYRDGNRVPITTDGLITTNIKTLVGNNTTVAVPIFTVQGTIECRSIWAVVQTTLGANNTAAYFRVNDGTNTPAITVATGTTLSAAPAHSFFYKSALAASALVLKSAAASTVAEPSTAETTFFSPFVVTALPGATANIEFVYSTTDTPTSGAIQFFLRWLPVSQDSNVIVL